MSVKSKDLLTLKNGPYPFGEESIVNIDNCDNQSNDKKYYLEIFCLHFNM